DSRARKNVRHLWNRAFRRSRHRWGTRGDRSASIVEVDNRVGRADQNGFSFRNASVLCADEVGARSLEDRDAELVSELEGLADLAPPLRTQLPLSANWMLVLDSLYPPVRNLPACRLGGERLDAGVDPFSGLVVGRVRDPELHRRMLTILEPKLSARHHRARAA